MIELKKILLPTDFSDRSADAARHACGLAEVFGSELHLLHILELHTTSTPVFGGGLAIAERVQESEAAARQQLERFVKEVAPQTGNLIQATAEGAPFVEILRYARQQEIDLIVMGTHGRSGLPHALLGSVAERVVRKATCPVLTVRPEGHSFVMP